ncbi:zinc finger CCHC domain-containing protein 8 homolog isoform X2 [Zootermopsis nevadensis]|uniref:zinc finger CCHC domain-containing protein 8 homolog isoform X2 n=1 Tax=Zootermopsis nevadensis TaxID=136037 RepID=UPI000B8ED7D7|nr:zinc finger CCHC domain-containing protein 8 homolog isoform X2 [Zootermopsis nevadensis]
MSNIVLDDNTNHDSSSVSASTSNNEESLDSCSNDRFVIGSATKKTSLPPSFLIGSDEDSDHRSLQVNSPFSVGKVDIKYDQQTKLRSSTNENRPIFSVSFRNQDVARKYKASIKTFLKDLIAKNDPDNEEDTSDLELDVWEAEEDGEDSQDHDSVDSSSLFKVDTHPTLKDNLDVPAYNHKFNEILQQTKDDIGKTSKNEGSSRSSCFNCLGNHSLRDCPLPHDPSAITKNRRQFSARFTRTQSKTSRYHLDDEQKFASFVPGQISNKLRKALGLAKHQLPNHIYKMRTLGYPPGWMEDAKISHSGLTLYDCKGKEVPDLETEEGEIIPEGSRDKYDIKKIISYPGFNVPCSPSTKDDFEFHECPPMTYEQSKERMLSQLSQNSVRAYKRPRIISNTACAPTKLEDQDITRADMEVDETPESAVNLLPVDDNCRFIPPLPKDTPPRPPPPPPPPSTESDSEGGESRSQGIGSPVSTGQSGMSSPRAQSPSLSDLETRKQLLLAELEDGGSSSDTTPRVAPQSTPGPSTSTLGKVKSVDLGTPILQSASPYSHLPSSEKFSHHICSVINFENLPDSTGNYERMSDLIRKVRSAVTRIQQEGDDCNDGGK